MKVGYARAPGRRREAMQAVRRVELVIVVVGVVDFASLFLFFTAFFYVVVARE